MLAYLYQLFAYLHRTLYVALLQTDDDFFTRCRKGIITVSLVFGIVNILTNTVAAVVNTSAWSVLRFVVLALIYVASLIWIATWLYARFTRRAPDWILNVILEVGMGLQVLSQFSSPYWGHQALWLSVAFAAVVIRTSHMKLHVAVSTFLFILNAYEFIGFPSILLPENYKGDKLGRQVVNGVMASLTLWFLSLTINEFSFLLAKSVAALRIVKEITKKLVVYDTEPSISFSVR